MKKLINYFFIGCIFLTVLSSCSKEEENKEVKPSQENNLANIKEEKNNYFLLTDLVGINDKSFNQSAWEGFQRAKKDFGIKTSYLKSEKESDYKKNISLALEKNPKLIFGIGFTIADSMQEKALLNPNTTFTTIDFTYDNLSPNLIGVTFKSQEPSFLVGYIAGKMTKTNKIGFIGGVKSKVIDQFEYGFRAGVRYANKDAKILIQYVQSFSDQAKAKKSAQDIYLDGADIIFQAAGLAGDGVVEAAKEQNKYVIGVDRDQFDLAPKNILTSAVKNIGKTIYHLIELDKKNKLKAGINMQLSIKDGVLDIAPTSGKHVPKNILNEVAKIKQDIIDEKIIVPYNEKTFKDFKI